MDLYTGGYTKAPNGSAEGIGHFTFDSATGAISPVGWVTGVDNPSFLAVSADGRSVYAVAEGGAEGAVVAYSRDAATGALTELNRQATKGVGPCYVAIDHSGRYVLVANYGSGSIAALPVRNDGSLGEATGSVQHEGSSVNPDRQEGPHAHMILSSPDGRFVFATDLGTDRIYGYTLNLDSGALAAAPDAGGASHPEGGPRHFAFSPDGGAVYVLNELDATLIRFAYDAATGAFSALQTVSTVPDGFDGPKSCAHVMVSPDGRFVYASNRGHDSIAIWEVADGSGELNRVDIVPSGGETPRNFALSPGADARWLLAANMGSDNVVVWPRNAKSGLPEGDGVTHDIASCCCLVFAGA